MCSKLSEKLFGLHYFSLDSALKLTNEITASNSRVSFNPKERNPLPVGHNSPQNRNFLDVEKMGQKVY